MAEKVFGWYRQSWERIMKQVPSLEQQEDLTDFVGLLGCRAGPLAEKQVVALLDWRPARRDWAQRLLRWLIVRRVEKCAWLRGGVLAITASERAGFPGVG